MVGIMNINSTEKKTKKGTNYGETGVGEPCSGD